MDNLTPEHRSWNMSRIRSTNTSPEKKVRSMLHSMGFRFRLHAKYLPGKPDIVMPRYKTVVMVHGCYWHRHQGCKFAYTPKSRVDFWHSKFDDNVRRDRRVRRKLRRLGWRVVVIWECQTLNREKLFRRIRRVFNPAIEQ